MTRVVIDTNVWVSSIINPFGFPAQLRKCFENGLFVVLISEAMLEELAEVLNRPRIRDKYGINKNDIEQLLLLIEERSENVLLEGDVSICRDLDDNFVIETAIKGKADFLVSRDDDIKFDRNVSTLLLQYKVTTISVANLLNFLGQ
ncbi:MAG TPA: putative toxin-antitoxin system toxin component, PIN family [Syntrophorhabdaceae bacterium]|nr:putative toxin-antitoxin system toxin component, PIN family [Syntrophorhabdaceae bacterium]HQP50900.1 putative toxin-antitoxin system toxin component, PIN family [Syntrophorhabdaceae bacterium]